MVVPRRLWTWGVGGPQDQESRIQDDSNETDASAETWPHAPSPTQTNPNLMLVKDNYSVCFYLDHWILDTTVHILSSSFDNIFLKNILKFRLLDIKFNDSDKNKYHTCTIDPCLLLLTALCNLLSLSTQQSHWPNPNVIIIEL